MLVYSLPRKRRVGQSLAALAGRIIVSDSFTRANNASSLGDAESGQTWEVLAGTWGITSNQAYCPTPGASNNALAVIESGVANVSVSMTVGSNTSSHRLAVRVSDVDNGFVLDGVIPTGYTLYRREAGSYNSIGSDDTTLASGDLVEIIARGSSLVVKVNGEARISATSTFNLTATKHGLGANDAACRYDNLSVRSL